VITLRGVSKSFGQQVLFENAALQINAGDRFALVGPNGAGKSTLFKLIMGLEQPDEGEVAMRQDITFGYLPQETPSLAGHSVLQEVVGEASDARRDAQAKKIMMGLGFKVSDFERPVSALSGGWQMRTMIGRLLLDEPDLLMLDEPTNHHDLESLLWFQNYLQSYRGAIFLISHDREFINAIVGRIVEVGERQLKIYTGDYESYLEQKKQADEQLRAAYDRQQKEIAELEDFIARFRAKASTASRAQAKLKYLEKMERIVLSEDVKTVGFAFPQPARSGQNVLTLRDIHQSYDGQRWIYRGLDLTLERGQRIAFVGPNGAGKSTLLKLVAGMLEFQKGERKLGYAVECGYFSQHRMDMFQPGRTVLEESTTTRRSHSEQMVRTLLGSFLFRGDSVFKKVEVLSGGEKSRLGLARLLLDPPNLLCMDEPTTHLDMASVETLVEALKKFEGTLCFISHDVYFIRQLATNILHVNQGQVTLYPGDYDYFLHKKAQEETEEGELFRTEERIEAAHSHPAAPHPAPAAAAVGSEPGKKPGSGPKSKEQKRLEAQARQNDYLRKQEEKRKQEIRQRLQDSEGLLLSELARPNTHQDPKHAAELARRLGEIQKQIKQLG
jgi:ATP-binding cassette subfamily F protein 3